MNTVEKLKEKWLKTREKGKSRFILNGILLWGGLGIISSFIFDYLFEWLFEPNPNYQQFSENLFPRILIRLIIWASLGAGINWLLWNKNEKEYYQNSQEK
ncbi:hypothetical protein BH10ACI1_BH10ACI1_27840 [soil metagenome]